MSYMYNIIESYWCSGFIIIAKNGQLDYYNEYIFGQLLSAISPFYE